MNGVRRFDGYGGRTRRIIDCRAAAGCDMSCVYVLDTETTGLTYADEVLSLAVVDGHGDTVFHDRFGTVRLAAWPEAERINGISPKDVEGLPSLSSRASELSELFADAEVIVGYNHVHFDMPYLVRAGVVIPDDAAYCDVMMDFDDICYLLDDRHVHRSLALCARFCSVHQTAAHTALDDARVTLACMEHLARVIAEVDVP